MTTALIERFLAAAQRETATSLQALCAETGAAESSVLFPSGNELKFFASTNPLLLSEKAPGAPIGASFSGAAFRSGQTLAIADAAGKTQHYGAVDALTHVATHEFAAIPIVDREPIGVLTLVNRADASVRPKPFDLDELRAGENFARQSAPALRLLAKLFAGDDDPVEGQLRATLTRLTGAERRVVAALAAALIQNRGR